ncbi:MAG: permease-like cell division protein FtsX [Clostridia bacterium]|nr:permease-like cell division protein FtsX [Clostridia bacterium]
MRFDTIGYLIKDSFHGMKKDLKNTLISLGTMFATMLLIAVAYLVYMNENKLINDTKDKASNIVAYVNVEVSDEKAKEAIYDIDNIVGVESSTYRDKQYAIELAKSMNPVMVEGFSDEVLRSIYPAYYVITFNDVRYVEGIVNQLSKISTIEEISVNQYAREKARDAEIYKAVAIVAVIYIIEFSVFLMMNTTKLMMYSKRKEISIMKYVGARNNFIRAPFAIQGVFTALLAVLLTVGIINIAYPAFVKSMTTLESGFSFLSLNSMATELVVLLAIIGVFIGILGSSASMKKYLDV